jgi:hypothetical protein
MSSSSWSLLGSLDADCALHVLSFLPADDLVRQRAVCRQWSAVASCDTLWRPHFLRLFGPTRTPPLKTSSLFFILMSYLLLHLKI